MNEESAPVKAGRRTGQAERSGEQELVVVETVEEMRARVARQRAAVAAYLKTLPGKFSPILESVPLSPLEPAQGSAPTAGPARPTANPASPAAVGAVANAAKRRGKGPAAPLRSAVFLVKKQPPSGKQRQPETASFSSQPMLAGRTGGRCATATKGPTGAAKREGARAPPHTNTHSHFDPTPVHQRTRGMGCGNAPSSSHT